MKTPKRQRKPIPGVVKWTAKEAGALIEAYFKRCDEEKEPYTANGLALALDTDRQTLWEWRKGEKKDEETSDVIKKATRRVELWWEKRIASQSAGGAIFWLKNHQWKDTQEIVGGETNVVVDLGAAAPVVRKFERELAEQLRKSIKKGK